MERLVAFGCSMTYGHGLVDCIGEDFESAGPLPSKYAWPTLLAKKLKCDVLNLGEPGASNKKILLNILNAKLDDTDHVVIYWAYPHRDSILQEDLGFIPITPWFQKGNDYELEDSLKMYYEIHNDYDMFTMTLIYINYAESYLQSKGIKSFHYFYDDQMIEYRRKFHPLTNCLQNVYMKYVNVDGPDSALDNKHPGPRTHELKAQWMYNDMKEREKMKNVDLTKYKHFVEAVTSTPSNDTTTLINRMNQLEKPYNNEGSKINPALLLTAGIGLASEGGEFNEIVKKMFFQSKPLNDENVFHMKRELGDIIWYWINACRALDLNPDDVIAENVRKLEARYPGGTFDVYQSENRKEGDI